MSVNYRFAEMVFITSVQAMDYLKKNYVKYVKDIAGAHGNP